MAINTNQPKAYDNFVFMGEARAYLDRVEKVGAARAGEPPTVIPDLKAEFARQFSAAQATWGAKPKPPIMLHDYVLVRADKAEEKTAGGIIRIDAEKPLTGVVVAIGPGTHVNGIFVATCVMAGEKIRFGKWAHDQNTVKRDVGQGVEELLMMRENDILWIDP